MQTGAMRLALEFADVLDVAAMRADRTVGPHDAFEVLAGLVFVGKNWVGDIDVHGSAPVLS